MRSRALNAPVVRDTMPAASQKSEEILNQTMKPYSVDLRQKIIDTYNNKEGSIRQVSVRFKVSRSKVQKLLKQYQEIGSLNPLPHGGGTAPKLHDYVPTIEKLLAEKNDATLPAIMPTTQISYRNKY